MYIKLIRIAGFKTYKDPITLSFKPRYNCIVGLNGSGKSNILNAIAFVMADLCGTRGTAANKRSVFHEGASVAVRQASVELVFDNTDRRFGLYKHDEVSVKRVMTPTKDDWFIDDRKVTKNAFLETMESIGFSRGNPYYIVRQGKVSELSQMSDKRRFELLCDIAGVKVYDDRRAASVKLLKEKDSELLDGDQALHEITTKMKRLKTEQSELREYQELDRHKRCLDYYTNTAVWKEAHDEEIAATDAANKTKSKIEALHEDLDKLLAEDESAAAEVAKVAGDLQSLSSQKNDLVEVRTTQQAELSSKKLSLDDIRSNKAMVDETKHKAEEELRELHSEIQQIESRIESEYQPACDAASSIFLAASKQQKLAEAEMSQLCAKRSRGGEYDSRQQRDASLARTLNDARRTLSQIEERDTLRRQELLRLEVSITQMAAQKTAHEAKRTEMPEAVEAAAVAGREATQDIAKVIERKRRLQGEVADLRKGLREAETKLRLQEDKFFRCMRNPLRNAIQEADRWRERNEMSITDVPGVLIHNIKVDPFFQIAVETTGRQQLLNYLVRDRHTLTLLASHIKHRRAGELTITPLLESKDVASKRLKYPENDDRVKPLVDCIVCDDHIRPAVNIIFGRVVLCDTLPTAAALHSAGYDFEYVTADGDTYSRNRTLAGGFIKQHSMRFHILQEISQAKRECEDLRVSIAGPTDELESMEQRTRELQQQEAACKRKEQTLVEAQTALHQQLHTLERDISRCEDRKDQLNSQHQTDERDLAVWQQKIKDVESEIASPLGDLSPDEENKLSELQSQMKLLESAEDKAAQEFYKARDIVTAEKSRLADTLRPRAHKLEDELSSADAGTDSSTEKELENEAQALTASIQQIDTELSTLHENMTNMKTTKELLSKQASERVGKESQLKLAIAKQTQISTRYEQLIETKRREQEAANAKRVALPGMSIDVDHQYTKMSKSLLERELTRVNQEVKEFAPVNKQAVAQYTNFKEGHEELVSRRATLGTAQQEVHNMIKTMDEKKDDVIRDTFRTVNRHFNHVFGCLVPAGIAKLHRHEVLGMYLSLSVLTDMISIN
eukprot:GHVQ01009974.1.p1 GENE.GHVQ01009974.1~~GHVQ01009974.1.p1  ORF type:complete len:1076 (+),score=197.58 GHVQ01009974.1:508-3735(+)